MKSRILILGLALAMFAAACSGGTGGGGGPEGGTQGTNPSTTELGDVTLAAALTRFDACESYLSYVKEHALEIVGPWGLPGSGYFGGRVVLEEGVDTVAPAVEGGTTAAPQTTTAAAVGDKAAGPSGPAPEPGVDYSTTNVQEEGVDEPDIVKTDGRRLLVLSGNVLNLFDVTGTDPVLVDSLEVADGVWVSDMLMNGDRVVLMAQASLYDVAPARVSVVDGIVPEYGYSPVSVLTEVDLTGDSMSVSRRLLLDGSVLSSRMIDGVVRVVVQSPPTGLQFTTPSGGLRGENDALEFNRNVIRNSTAGNWLPFFILQDAEGRQLADGDLVACENAYHPEEFSGLNLLSVVTFDLGGEGLASTQGTGVLADGQTVYAGTENLYVATTRWIDWQAIQETAAQGRTPDVQPVTTAIHQFDISDPRSSTYLASGSVEGTVLNQYSMSELDGRLRVATTKEALWWEERPPQDTSSTLWVLERDGRSLDVVGSVGDLGRGERIFAVRFLGDLAAVVTFRQTDPLYLIDLSDPAAPEVAGELKINGYSAYLHPVGENLLLGVGQDATDEGRTLGTQVSLFDISDRTNPVRVSKWTIPGGSSDVEFDPRAFLFWEPRNLIVLPVNRYGAPVEEFGPEPEGSRNDFFFGAEVLQIVDGELVERAAITQQSGPILYSECDGPLPVEPDGGTGEGAEPLPGGETVPSSGSVAPAPDEAGASEELIAPPPDGGDEGECYQWYEFDWSAQIRRSLVVGDSLITVSQKGVMATDLDTFVNGPVVTFPGGPVYR